KPTRAAIRDEEPQPPTEDGREGPDAESPDDDLPPDDTFVEDYEIQFARDLVAQARGWKRRDVLASSRSFFDRKVSEEQMRVTEALKKLGVDWSPVAASGPLALAGSLSTDQPRNEVNAGATVQFRASITNKGAASVGQVRAQIKSDDPLLEDREFVFGRIKPGETRTWMVP